MTEKERAIIKWLNSERNYTDGVALYIQYGKNPHLKQILPGREKFYSRKLVYELGKLIGISFKQFQEKEILDDTEESVNLQQAKEAANDAESHAGEAEEHADRAENAKDEALRAADEAKEAADKAKTAAETLGAVAAGEPVQAGNYPHVINRIIAESSRLYNERSMLKKQQNTIPDENTPENIEKRRAIIQVIESLSDRLDVLYTAKKAYLENNIVPDAQQLFPPSGRIPLPETDTGQLIIKRNNLRSSITRAKNMLEYQSQKKGSKPNPMPDCPKRGELEKRIADKEKELAEIETTLKNADQPVKSE